MFCLAYEKVNGLFWKVNVWMKINLWKNYFAIVDQTTNKHQSIKQNPDGNYMFKVYKKTLGQGVKYVQS